MTWKITYGSRAPTPKYHWSPRGFWSHNHSPYDFLFLQNCWSHWHLVLGSYSVGFQSPQTQVLVPFLWVPAPTPASSAWSYCVRQALAEGLCWHHRMKNNFLRMNHPQCMPLGYGGHNFPLTSSSSLSSSHNTSLPGSPLPWALGFQPSAL